MKSKYTYECPTCGHQETVDVRWSEGWCYHVDTRHDAKRAAQLKLKENHNECE